VAEFDTKELLPEDILQRWMVKKGCKAIPQVLVKWAGTPKESTTWDDWYVLQAKLPGDIAGGPAIAQGGGGDVMTRTTEEE
jgi:hypothetical protein